MAQKTHAPRIAITPAGSSPPPAWCSQGAASHVTPANPDEQRGDARRDRELGPDDESVAAEQEEGADHRVGPPLARRRPGRAAPPENSKEDRAGEQETSAGHQEWRHRLDGDADAEIGATPDQIDGGKGEDQRGARRRGGFRRRRRRKIGLDGGHSVRSFRIAGDRPAVPGNGFHVRRYSM